MPVALAANPCESASFPPGARAKQPAANPGHAGRRFLAGLENFDKIYKPLVDEWLHYDNAGSEPVLLDRGTKR